MALSVMGPLESRVLCPAVPVRIMKLGSTESIVTYMGMDSFATASYIDQDLPDQLGYAGQTTTLKLMFFHQGKDSEKCPGILVER